MSLQKNIFADFGRADLKWFAHIRCGRMPGVIFYLKVAAKYVRIKAQKALYVWRNFDVWTF